VTGEGGGIRAYDKREMHTWFWLKNLNKRDSLVGLRVDEG